MSAPGYVVSQAGMGLPDTAELSPLAVLNGINM